MSERPTIPELVPQWTDLGFTKRQAVHHIVDAHMQSSCARGKGYKAGRRAQALFDRLGRDIEALQARIARNRRQWAADEAAERRSEYLTYRRTADVVNPHDD